MQRTFLRLVVVLATFNGCSNPATSEAGDDAGGVPDSSSDTSSPSDTSTRDVADVADVADGSTGDALVDAAPGTDADAGDSDGSIAIDDGGPVADDPDTVVIYSVTQAAGEAAKTTTSMADRAAKIKALLSGMPGVGAVTQDATYNLHVTLPSGQTLLVLGNRLAPDDTPAPPIMRPMSRVYDLPKEKSAVIYVMEGGKPEEFALQSQLGTYLDTSGYLKPTQGHGTIDELLADFAGAKVGVLFWASHGTADHIWTGTPYTDAADKPFRSEVKVGTPFLKGSVSNKRLWAKMADGVPVMVGLGVTIAPLTDSTTGKGYYAAGYAITSGWVSKHMHLAPSAFVYLAQCSTLETPALVDAFHGIGAETYIGFDKLAWLSPNLYDGPKRIFQGVLGLDTFEPQTPKMRPFDVQAIFDWQKSNSHLYTKGSGTDGPPWEYNDPLLKRWTLNEVLAPSIEKVFVGGTGTTVTLSNTKRATSDRGKVYYGTTQLTTCGPASADIYDVNLVCDVPEAARATAADVWIDYKGTLSNKVKMTQWTGHAHYEEHGPLGYTIVFDVDFAFAADIHGFRTDAFGTATPHNNNNGYCSATLCKGTYAFSGGPSSCLLTGSGPMTVTPTLTTPNALWASAFVDPSATTPVKLRLDAFGTVADCAPARQGEAGWGVFADTGVRNTFALAMDDSSNIKDKTYSPVTIGGVTYTLSLTGFKVANTPDATKDFE